METTTFKEKSSFTADGVAYRRTFTDIPLSQEIWGILLTLQAPPTLEELKRMVNRTMLAFFEARYLMTDKLLEKSGIRQVFELAAGLSIRGALFAQETGARYVELDLPGEIKVKRKIMDDLLVRRKIADPQGLYFVEGDVTNPADFAKASSYLSLGSPIAVICEGLLRYISFADKEILGKSIHDLLKQSGGMWITPDVEFLPAAENAVQTSHFAFLKEKSGIDIRPNLFKDEIHAVSFFEGLGFSVEKIPLDELVPVLASPRKAALTQEEIDYALRDRWTYVMRPL